MSRQDRLAVNTARRGLSLIVSGVAALALGGPALAQTSDDVFASLPREERANAQIGWYVNTTFDAMVRAVEENKAIVLVLGDSASRKTIDLGAKVAPCPQLNQLAGAAIFAYGSLGKDEFARRIARSIGATVVPTILVLEPRTDKVSVIYKIEGVFDAALIASDVRQALVRGGLWPAGRSEPQPLPQHYLLYAGLGCTHEGALRLGILDPD